MVCCDGVKPKRLPKDATVFEVRSGGEGDVNLRVGSMSAAIHAAPPPRANDLLRLAAYVYWADQMVPRRTEIDVAGDQWGREFRIYAPVSDPDFWSQPSVIERLKSVLRYGTGDAWDFHFSKDTRDLGQLTFPNKGPDFGADCVSLFSGGLDSLCAATEAAVDERKRVLLVGHSSNPRVLGRQMALFEELRRRTGVQLARMSLELNKPARTERDPTQRSRGFLYSAMGAAVAASVGVGEVRAADNGFVSVALPWNGQVIGSMSSRSTHPRFQRLFNALLAEVLPSVQIWNPLLDRTRAETLESLQAHGLVELISKTHSCASARALTGNQHCGKCSQCLDRRISVAALGLTEFDCGYAKGVLDPLSPEEHSLAEGFVRLGRKLAQSDAEGVFDEYVELFDCLIDEPDALAAARKIGGMLVRQGTTLLKGFEAIVTPFVGLAVKGVLPAASLVELGLTIPSRSDYRSIIAVHENPDPRLPFPIPADVAASIKAHHCLSHIRVELAELVGSRTVVRLDGRGVSLTDAQFTLLLRLVVGLVETEEGWLKLGDSEPGGLAEESWFKGEHVEQAVFRLRDRLAPMLGDVKHTDFIQVVRRKVRLSTVLELVRFDRQNLATHPNHDVRDVAGRLPDAVLAGGQLPTSRQLEKPPTAGRRAIAAR